MGFHQIVVNTVFGLDFCCNSVTGSHVSVTSYFIYCLRQTWSILHWLIILDFTFFVIVVRDFSVLILIYCLKWPDMPSRNYSLTHSITSAKKIFRYLWPRPRRGFHPCLSKMSNSVGGYEPNASSHVCVCVCVCSRVRRV